MGKRRICVIDGHPDPTGGGLVHALARAYAEGARAGGHELREIIVAQTDFPLLQTRIEFEAGELPPAIRDAQEAIRWADHLVILYPLWLGMLPARLKGFFEQVFRYGFAMEVSSHGWRGHLKGRSARVVVTMGMPALFYRLWFGAHSLRALRANLLGFSGIRPTRSTLFGSVGTAPEARRARWLRRMHAMGRAGR